MGFWAFVQPRVETAVRELVEGRSTAEAGGGAREDEKTNRVHRRSIRYVGRPASASPASGSQTIHARENKALVDEALGGL
jgi:2-oxoglutarate dehydrogenase E1 component